MRGFELIRYSGGSPAMVHDGALARRVAAQENEGVRAGPRRHYGSDAVGTLSPMRRSLRTRTTPSATCSTSPVLAHAIICFGRHGILGIRREMHRPGAHVAMS